MSKKKDFSTAMNFITMPTETTEEIKNNQDEGTLKKENTSKEEPSELEKLLASKGYTEVEINKALANLGYSKVRETKSRRVQLLIKPSQYEALKGIAAKKNTSINMIIEQAINSYIENN